MVENRKQRRRRLREHQKEKTGRSTQEVTITEDVQASLATVSVDRRGTQMRMQEIPWTSWVDDNVNAGCPVVRNSRYIVHVYPPKQQYPGIPGHPRVVHLSIRHVLNIAITDFRDFQRIKNELVHPEAEAVQVFPAESRLVDTCNQYHLFVNVPDSFGKVPVEQVDWTDGILPMGYFYGRDVAEATSGDLRQRAWTDAVPAEVFQERDKQKGGTS
jgi:hypothetical protein